MLEIVNLKKTFDGGTKALRGVNLKVKRGEFLSILGPSGSGKTTLAKRIVNMFKAKWLNADEIRKKYNDWDFSSKGRIRQAKRLSRLAEQFRKNGNTVVTDFVCPTPELRKIFKADYLIWMDTIKKGRFEDTNQMFVNHDKIPGQCSSYVYIARIWFNTFIVSQNLTRRSGRHQRDK